MPDADLKKRFAMLEKHRKRCLRAIWVALAICGFIAAVDWGIEPLYRTRLTHHVGLAPLSATMISTSSMLQLPSLEVVILGGVRAGRHTTSGIWWTMLAISFSGYFLSAWALIEVWVWLSKFKPVRSDDAKGIEIAQPSRRSVLKIVARNGLATGLGSVVGVTAWGMIVEPRRIEITRRRATISDLDPALDGLRIVQLSDLHHGPFVSLTYLRHAIELANAEKPDLVMLTGDYVLRSPIYLRAIIDAFRDLTPSIGVVATMGNHDWWEDGPLTQRAFKRTGIPLLDNDRRVITPDRKLVVMRGRGVQIDRGLCIAGVGDLWTDRQDYDSALAGVPSSLPTLLMSHNPDVAEEPTFLAARRDGMRVDMMFSGHTHGGQIAFPVIGAPIVPSRYGQKYLNGIVQGPACPVHMSRGLGLTGVPLRLSVRPEISVLDLVAT